nr:MAG: Prophage endopeptidase tail [Bacteriophage sp.]
MGTNIIITKPNGSRVSIESRATATAITAAKQTWALNAEDTIAITVVSPFPQSYGIGDVITVFGRDYRLNRLPKVSKTGMQEYQYDLEFEGIQYDLMRVTYDVNINTTNNQLQDIQGDSLTGDLKRFMEVLISNANRVFPGKWALGVCPETDGDNTLTFSESDNCLSVLQTLCSEDKFGVEFEIERVNGVYVINIKKTIGQTLPFVLEYGKGKGLYFISRENVSSSNIVTRLKVYGSTENITSKYRADRLCMFGKDKASSYIEKADAVAKYGIFEGRKNFDIKPTFTGKVSSVVDGDVLSFIDTSFPFDINAKNASGETLYLISGVSAKVHFNSGNLAGYEFEVHDYDHATHKFTLIKQTDDRGNMFPSETSPAFRFAKDDTYKVLDIAYSPEIEEAAEKQLAEEGNKYYDQNSQPKVQYSVNVTKAFIEKKLALSDGITNVFAPGDYLPIKDDEIGVDKSIRIKSFTRNVLDPYDYSLTISDTQTKGDITTRVISDLVDIDKVLTINNLKDPAQARANWRSSREVLNMVFDPETGGYYKDKITPESVDTMMLSVGAKSMQFGLINTVFEPNFQGNPNLFKWKGGVLTHYTIDPDKARSWVLANGTTALQQNVPYYIYAVCNRDNSAGTMGISTTQHKVEESPNVYFFLIGILGSIDADTKVRAISLTYGFTTINGRFIKTGRIESADGTTYFDLDKSEIGGRIVFTQNGQEKTLEELGSEAMESKDFINNTLPGILDEIKAQLDGQIEQHFYQIDPSPLSTAPDSEDGVPNSGWTDTNTKENHLGDLYYNTTSGKVWRYVKIQWRPKPGFAPGTFYVWQELQDSELAQAIAIANEALELGKEKNRIFTSTPVPPYDVGDLWVQGATGDIMRCKTARESGAFTSSDWEKASKYTDDSALKNFINGDFANAIDTMTEQIDGKIETWFQTSDPASNWTTDAEKAKHVGDMWYNSSTKLLKCYRQTFRFVNGIGTVVYIWQTIEDKKAIDAYDAASKAQDTADGKRRVFVAQPYPPYDVGDLWVDGKELRRCITARESGSWNTNDWVVAVYYDNTQTTIDGGIVTSGTIQCAGDNKSILAGITGNGTASDSIRFWAGASFENRKTAPFRVMQDGSVVMSKAQVEGVINAITGSIGGFRIQQGQIGYGSSDEQDTTNGLALLNNFIRFNNGKQRVLLGCLSSLGYPYNGYLSLTDNKGTTLELHHDNPSTSDANNEHWYQPKALGVYGNQYNIGKVAAFENGYIGEAYTDIIESWFAITQKFHFTANTTEYLNVKLPTLAQVNKQTNNVPTIFDIEIVCDRNMRNRIRVSPQSGCTLYNNDGNSISGLDMERGDSLTLRYYNGGWMVVNKQYTT